MNKKKIFCSTKSILHLAIMLKMKTKINILATTKMGALKCQTHYFQNIGRHT